MHRVALTFDDGPDERATPLVLDALAACGAVATFFVLAPAALARPAIVARCRAEGHAVELHGWAHLRHPQHTAPEIAADTARALEALASLGVEPTWWRLPWGLAGPGSVDVAAAHGLRVVGWTADTEDWDGAPTARLLERVRPRLGADAVVLAHDGIGPGARRTDADATVGLVGPLVAAIRSRGGEPALLGDLGAVSAAVPS